MSSSFLTIDSICKRYGLLRALEAVSLDVTQGEFLTLLGPSGSGKSTLLAILAGFAEPDQGIVRLNGRDITRLAPEARRFGVVPQGYGLFPHLTVYENIAFPLRVRRSRSASINGRVRQVMELLQIGSVKSRLPRELSGGQQQRVALARALSFEPDLLLLDEPMSALDALLRRDLQAELVRLHRQVGTTFVYVTHDQQEALALSDRIVVLNHGRIEQIGTPRSIYAQPATRFVANFLGKNNLLQATAAIGPLGRLHFHWNGHRIAAGVTAPFEGPCSLTIRPEAIVLTKVGHSSQGTKDRILGTVVNHTFHGASADVIVAVGHESLTVTLTAAASPPVPGDEVWLAFDAERLWCLPEADTISPAASATSPELAA
ncbi:ABC transporter ATP-binding protein [Bradyrhizobium uaiense]|uniref:ABC transporter ATP-binding protein n=1 Tax=Bradyrhizobium uaiense TaxID=2594946 RepID=UPI001F1F3EB3|nr:ABC transporter ATP-binding protein [Bradyrhizobium uaiense]